MKHIKKYTLGLFAVAVVLLSGCTNEMDEPVMQDGIIRITSLDVNTDGVLTRAADANGYDGMVKITWAGGDELSLTIGDFIGKARYYYMDESNKGWEILNADDTPVIGGIEFTKMQMNEGIDVRASYSRNGVEDAYNDVLLAEETDRTRVGDVIFTKRNDNPDAFTLVLGLVHAKSYIAVNLTNNITDASVQGLQVVLRNSDGATIATSVAMKANSEMTAFECFAEAAYIEKFVVTMLRSDNTTYEIPVIPTYGADNKGFAIETNNRYPFNITLNPSNQTRAFGSDAKGYGTITFNN